MADSTPNGTDAAGALEAEQRRLENALHHLRRSNQELREALLQEPGEQVYEEAIEENERVIEGMEARVAALRAAILEARARGAEEETGSMDTG